MTEETPKLLLRAAACATLVCWWLASVLLVIQFVTGAAIGVGK